MPNIDGLWVGPHPTTGEIGVWFAPSGQPGVIVGRTRPELRAIPTGGGNAAQRRSTYTANANANLTTLLGNGCVVKVTIPADGSFDVDNVTVSIA